MKIGGNRPGIGANHTVNGSGSKETAKKGEAGAGQSTSGCNVDISSRAREFGKIKSMLDSVPEVRGEVVVRLKTDIDSGSYAVDAGKVAEKMIERAIRSSLYAKK